jgi:tRNA (cmo5U34)-methyltransferase
MPKSDNRTPHSSGDYDVQVRSTIPYYDLFHEETIDLIKAFGEAPKLWLDTGCGTGTLVAKALEAFAETEFILADPSPEMLEQAEKKLSGSKRIRFLPAAATQDLPPLREAPDVITAIQSHHYLSEADRKKATEVCYGLLNEGGVYVTFENIRPFTEAGIELGKRNWSSFQIAAGKDEQAVEKHMERFDSEYFPITVEEHIRLLDDCGFSVAEILWYSRMQAGFYAIK